MRKLAIAMALSTSLLASPALARDGAFYIGAEFGPMIVEDIDFDLTQGTTTTGDAITIDADRGFDGDVIVGYDFGAFRLEAEVAYKENDLDTIGTGVCYREYNAPRPSPSPTTPTNTSSPPLSHPQSKQASASQA